MARHCALKLPSLIAAFLFLACSSGSRSGGTNAGGTSNSGGAPSGNSGTANASGTTGNAGSSSGSGGSATNTGGTSGGSSSNGGTMSNGGTSVGGSGDTLVDGGASSMGGMDSDGGAPTPTIVGTLGQPCTPDGAYGCAGQAQKGQLVCMDGEWATNGTCAGAMNCDSTDGPNAGSCQPILAECAGKAPGATFCRSTEEIFQCGPQQMTCNPSERVQCGPDLVTLISVEQCPHLCTDGECTGTICENGYTCTCDEGPYFTCDDRAADTYAQCIAQNRICACGCECSAGKVLCNGVCTSLGADDHCGDCDTACPTAQGASCHTGVDPNMGYCACDAPELILCPNGQCRVSCPP